MPFITYVASASFVFETVKALHLSLPFKNKNDVSISPLITSTFFISICLGIFTLGSVSFSFLHPNVNQTMPKEFKLIYNIFAPYKIANSYLLPKELVNFETRKEIVIQGANDVKGPWYEYQFLYKPGNVNVTPPIIGMYFILLLV